MNEQSRPNITPAVLAEPLAMNLMIKGVLENPDYQDYEQEEIVRLDCMAQELQLVEKKYTVKSIRSLLLPSQYHPDELISTVRFNELDFEAEFLSYSTLRSKRQFGYMAISGLCLTFKDVTLLPDRDVVPEDRLLYVPVYSVQDMDMINK